MGELRLHEEDPGTAIALVAAGGAVLVVAHSYSQLIAAAAVNRAVPSRESLATSLLDQLVLAVPAALAVGVLALAAAHLVSLRVAYRIVLAGSLTALFVLGVAIGIHHQRSLLWRLGVGSANVAVGVIIIGVEITAAH